MRDSVLTEDLRQDRHAELVDARTADDHDQQDPEHASSLRRGAARSGVSRRRRAATATRAAQSSSATPVCWSTGIRPGPAAPPRTVAGGAGRERPGSPARAAPTTWWPRRRATTAAAAATSTSSSVERAGAPVAEADGEGALAGHRVGRDVAQVVGDQDRAGERADADRGVQRRPLPRLGLDVRRADDRDQPEEHEDHHLAEPEVAVGLRAAGVEPGGERRTAARRRPATRRWWRRAPARRRRRRRTPGTPRASPRRGVAAPEPTSRIGPTRSSSVPRMPSE